MSTIDSPGSVPRKKARLRTRVHLLKLLCLARGDVDLAISITEDSTQGTLGNALPLIVSGFENVARAVRLAGANENSRSLQEIIETLGPP